MNKLTTDIINTLIKILPEQENMPLHEPFFEGNEKNYLMDCIDSRFVSSIGKYVDKFEEMLVEFTGAKHAIATVNGSSALHIALKLANVSPDHEVLVPSLTFVATANAVTYCGATPHFIDCTSDTLCLDVEKLDDYLNAITQINDGKCINKITNKVITAVIPVHIFGHPVDMYPLLNLSEKYHLKIIEDAAESLGSYYKEKHTGNFGMTSALSFNGNKTITTGGGGAILCNDPALAKQAKHITTTAKKDKSLHHFHDQVGFNYRMPNINAALGCAQLEQLPAFLKKKRQLSERYKAAFCKIKGISLLWEANYAKSNFWLNTLLLDKPDKKLLETILENTNKIGIQTRPVWSLINKLPMYKKCPSMDLSVAKQLEKQIINIPSSINLAD
jgi:perosamine synthetase